MRTCIAAYAQYHNKRVCSCRLTDKRNLMVDSGDKKNDRVTLWLEIDVDEWTDAGKVMYQPGDHVGMFAANRKELVSAIIPYLQYDQDPDEPMELQLLKEKHTSTGETPIRSQRTNRPICRDNRAQISIVSPAPLDSLYRPGYWISSSAETTRFYRYGNSRPGTEKTLKKKRVDNNR